MLRLAAERHELRIVADQIGAPTWSATIAAITASVLGQGLTTKEGLYGWGVERSGVYHLSASGYTSWAGFAQAIFEEAALDKKPQVLAISSRDYPMPARRPANSRLETTKLSDTFGLVPPHWRDALALCVAAL
jgi:dTDP-4-dehydrorhamnose reductase